ncbi:MAG: hypothetical protein ACFFGZ_02660 [Candidatus Thorarchaeota archaeon]
MNEVIPNVILGISQTELKERATALRDKVLGELSKRRNFLWNRIIVEQAVYYSTLFIGALFHPQLLPRWIWVYGPPLLLVIAAIEGINQVRVYILIDRINRQTLPEFTTKSFPSSTWVRINPHSPLAQALELSKSGLILLSEVPEEYEDHLGKHLVAVGTLNGLRRICLPVSKDNAPGILQLALGLLSAKNPEKGYIYGRETLIQWFGEIFRRTFGSSEIEVWREYEREERTEYYLSLGSTLALAILHYFEQINLLQQSLSVRVAAAEGLITAFGNVKNRAEGPHSRPPAVLLRQPPPFSRELLASVGILTARAGADLKIPFSELRKLANMELPIPFATISQIEGPLSLREPIPLFNVYSSLLSHKTISTKFLRKLGKAFYGTSLANDYFLRKYQEEGLIIRKRRGIFTSGPNFGLGLNEDEQKVAEAYCRFLKDVGQVALATLASAEKCRNRDALERLSREELIDQIRTQKRTISALQLKLLALQNGHLPEQKSRDSDRSREG